MKSLKLVIPVIGILLLSVPSPGLTEEAKEGKKEVEGEKVIKLKEMVVKEEMIYEPQKSEVKIADSTTQIGETPVDVIQHEVGIDIQRRSLMTPKSKMFRLRGFDSEKTLITLDGRPINGSGVYGGYQIDWSMMQLEDIEKIEIIRGATSAEFGNTIGGVINLVTKEPTEKFECNFNYGYKRWQTYQFKGFLSGKFNPFDLQSNYKPFGFTLGGHYLETNGYLRNSEVRRKAFSPSLYYYFSGGGKLKAGLRYSEGRFETPVTNFRDNTDYNDNYPSSKGHMLVGPGVRPASGTVEALESLGLSGVVYGDDSYFWKKRYEWDVALDKKFLDIDWEARFYYNYEDREDKYYARGTVGDTRKGDLIFKKDCPPDDSWGWKLKATKMFRRHRLKIGIEGNNLGYGGVDYEYTDQNYLMGPSGVDEPDQHEVIRLHSAFFSDRYSLLDNLDIYLGLRFDDYNADDYSAAGIGGAHSDHFHRFSPKFGIYYHPALNIGTFFTFARTAKFPIVPKHYWYYVGLQPGMCFGPPGRQQCYDFERPRLKYEEADQYEFGINYTGIRDTEISLKYYHYNVDNYLRWIFGYPRSRVVYNMDEVKIRGIELAIDGRLYRDFYGYANWAWQETHIRGSILADNSMSDLGFPENKINFGLKYQPKKDCLAKIDFKYVDSREEAVGPIELKGWTAGPPGERPMDMPTLTSYWLVNVLVKYPVNDYGTVYVGCENLLNENYEETYGFRMPERMLYGGVEFKF